MNQYIPEVSFRMMPTEEVSVAYRKHLLVYDNLDGKSKCINFSESIFPLKLQFTLVTICCEGEVQISANLEDYTLHPGDIDILVTGAIISRHTFKPGIRVLLFCISEEDPVDYLETDEHAHFRQSLIKGEHTIHMPKTHMDLFIRHYHLLCEWIHMKDYRCQDMAIKGILITMTSLLMNNINTKLQPVQSRAEQIFHDYIALVRKNYKQHREVNYYAEQLFITPKYLGKIIKEYSGRRPGDLIRDYVILEAKAMLRTKQYTVNQVADALNFPTSSFFCRYFRQVVGTSPMKF